jgi:hypothetical protein
MFMYSTVYLILFVVCVPCYHGMEHPPVVGRGDSLQIWRAVSSILNKQSARPDKRFPFSLSLVSFYSILSFSESCELSLLMLLSVCFSVHLFPW